MVQNPSWRVSSHLNLRKIWWSFKESASWAWAVNQVLCPGQTGFVADASDSSLLILHLTNTSCTKFCIRHPKNRRPLRFLSFLLAWALRQSWTSTAKLRFYDFGYRFQNFCALCFKNSQSYIPWSGRVCFCWECRSEEEMWVFLQQLLDS
jgi:hypothetical protein